MGVLCTVLSWLGSAGGAPLQERSPPEVSADVLGAGSSHAPPEAVCRAFIDGPMNVLIVTNVSSLRRHWGNLAQSLQAAPQESWMFPDVGILEAPFSRWRAEPHQLENKSSRERDFAGGAGYVFRGMPSGHEATVPPSMHPIYSMAENLGQWLWKVGWDVARALDGCLVARGKQGAGTKLESHLSTAPGGFTRLIRYWALMDDEKKVQGSASINEPDASADAYGRWLWREWHCDRSVLTLSAPSIMVANGRMQRQRQDVLVYRDRVGGLFAVKRPSRSQDALIVHLGLGAGVASAGGLTCSEHAIAASPSLQHVGEHFAVTRPFGFERLWLGVFLQPIPGNIGTSHPVAQCDDYNVWALGDVCEGGWRMQDMWEPADVVCCAAFPFGSRHYWDVPFEVPAVKPRITARAHQ